jgi:hypothetical protein
VSSFVVEDAGAIPWQLGRLALRWALVTLRGVLVSAQPMLGIHISHWPEPHSWHWFEEAVTWHTNSLIAEHTSRTPATVSVHAGMHANGWEGWRRDSCRSWGVHKWVARILVHFKY